MNNQLVSTIEKPEVAIQPEAVHLVARDAQQMAASTAQLTQWLNRKIADESANLAALGAAALHAKSQGWQHSTLDNQVLRSRKRVGFYTKVLAAVQAGYTIVPNFPIDLFAIRVTRMGVRARPGKGGSHWSAERDLDDENCDVAKLGDGRYESPSQVVRRSSSTNEEKKETTFFAIADDFADIEFPITAALPEIMKATTEAMALKVFDEIGICPQRRANKGDPLIIGRIIDNSTQKGWARDWPKAVSFLIAWHIDLRTL